jgi:putative oxidoreductase
MLNKILFGGESGLSPIANIGIALLRIFAGVSLMLAHGAGKIPPSEKFIEGTANIGFPIPTLFAWAAGLSEFAGGALLALGLFTRVSSFFIAFTMLVAVVGVHFNDPFGKKELGLLYLFIALMFLLKGAGDWSVDALIRKK